MQKIRILQVGLGPLGIKIKRFIDERSSMETIAALDINTQLYKQDLGELAGKSKDGVLIENDIAQVKNLDEVDVAVLTTSSSLASIESQIEMLASHGIPVVSTCEELSYPWDTDKNISERINKVAIKNGVAVVGTGVNPGFLMDTLPTMLTGLCQDVSSIKVSRIQDARTRRIPFQKKIGAGLTMQEFEAKKQAGTLRHVGLTESMQFIANALGWELDQTEDKISPIIATQEIRTEAMVIPKGYAMGVQQIGRGIYKGDEKISLMFRAGVGLGESYDEVKISGTPDINSRIEGGVNGDIATCAIVLNTIPNVIKSSSGLKTMNDLSIVSFTA